MLRTLAIVLLLTPVLAVADVVITSPSATITLSDGGVWKSLRGADGTELCAAGVNMPLARVNTAKGNGPCTSAKLAGSTLTLGFAKSGTEVAYELTPTPRWLLLKLTGVSGERPTSMTLCQIPVNLSEKVGPRLNAAYDAQHAVCLRAANRQADCGASRGAEANVLQASTQDAPGPKLEGAAVALIVCTTPELKSLLREASHEFGLLTNEDAAGVPVKETELRRGSYWFITVGAQDADKVIEYCKLTGFKQVMLGSGSWCRDVGHYTFAEGRFRDEAALKAFVDRLHANDIKVGMHCFASKVSKTDAYVTPVPDRRFWVDRRSVLAADITADQTEIRAGDLKEWAGSPVASQKLWEGGVDKHREVILDDEIIQYETIGPEGAYDTFLGCKRGAWGTRAGAHKAGTDARHYGVDGCINGYIIDQETTLLDETTTRLAGIFNRCGFDMIYFDGGEDVDKTRFNYYVSNFQETLMRKITKRPIIHMGTIMTHPLWHSFARSSTVDVYLATLYGAIQAGAKIDKWPSVRDHINHSVDYMISVGQDMMPGELGWFGIWPKQQNTDGLQLDETEYLMCKSLGYDVPISLETGFGQMDSHPLTPGILEIVRVYEDLRMNRQVDEPTRQALQEKGKDFALVMIDGKPQFVPVTPLESVGGGTAVRGEIGPLGSGAVATLWHYLREADILVPLKGQGGVFDFEGKPVTCDTQDGKLKLHVGNRRLTLMASLSVDELRAALRQAEIAPQPARRIWIQAETAKLVGEMALGSKLGLTEPGSFGDFVVCTGLPGFDQPQEWYAEYTVGVPREGMWTLWSRVRYPGGGDMSFGLWLPDEPLSLSGDKAIGNCGTGPVDKWHWTGRGGGVSSEPPCAAIRMKLPKGPFTFRVVAREGKGSATMNPRLDLMLLTDDVEEVPTDETARSAGLRQ